MQTPRAFISHSSEDRSSVKRLAERLRSSQVDAWYAEWEIGPGDSIVQKIDQGLSECEVFVIVISKNSVESRWVQEELSSAVVRRISQEAKIIPVRLDDSPVPTVINHLHWVKMPPPEEEFDKLLKSIFGVNDKPPLGTTPEFISRGLDRRQTTISGFSSEASAILTYLTVHGDLFEPVSIDKLRSDLGLNNTELADGLDELEERSLIDVMGSMLIEATPKALAWLYVESDYLGFDPLRDMLSVAQIVVGHDQVDAATLEADTGLPPKRLNIAALALKDQGYLHLIQTLGTAPYLFAEAWAIRQTRQWIREHQ
jgi:hypothetical protein